MPIFEYGCSKCGHEFETLVRNGAAPPDCPSCGSAELDKKLSVPAKPGASAEASSFAGACGACGHPDGPGACKPN